MAAVVSARQPAAAARTSRVPAQEAGELPGGPASARSPSSCLACCAIGRSRAASRCARCVTRGTPHRAADATRTRSGTTPGTTGIIRSLAISGTRGIRRRGCSTRSRRNSNEGGSKRRAFGARHRPLTRIVLASIRRPIVGRSSSRFFLCPPRGESSYVDALLPFRRSCRDGAR